MVEATGESVRSETEMAAENEESIVKESAIPQAPKSSDNFGKGVIFYLRENVVVGVLLWNVFNKMPLARKVFRYFLFI